MGGNSSKQTTNLPKISEDALAQNPPFKIGEPIYDINQHMKKSHPHWEFASIEKQTSITPHTYDVAFLEDNKPKNRYTFVVPYDHTRVKLTTRESDYINASYITGHVEKAYIATQGPLPDTFEDFWHMCWLENVRVIVMLTKTFENGRMKCHKYWPDDDETEFYGDIEVSCTLTNDDTELDIIHRTLRLKYRGEERTIEHYQYHGWPDHGVPSNSKALRSLLKEVQKIREQHKTPVVVHCSAGIGRTGTFCAVDTILSKLEHHVKNNINSPFPFKIYETVLGLRGERTGMVQQPEQYRFCYEAILDGAVEMGYLKSHTDVVDHVPLTASKSAEAVEEPKRRPISKAYSMSNIPKHKLTRTGSVNSTKSDLIEETDKKMKKSKKKKKSKKSEKKHKKTKSKGEIKIEEKTEEPRAGLPHSDSNLSITTSCSPEMESEMTKKRSVSTSN